MSIQVLELRRSDPPARLHPPSFRSAWMGTGAAPFAARDARSLPQGPGAHAEAFRRAEDRQFLEMRRAFDDQGGWICSDKLARRMRHRWEQPISVLAQWIVKRQLVSVAWHSQILIPLFQFDSEDLHVRPVVRAALSELEDVFDDWEIGVWFTHPNTWLREQRPVELATRDDTIVIEAARADRFIARG